MDVQVLHIDDCPNWLEAGARLESALADIDRTDVVVEYRLVSNSEDAEALSFAGSPTIIVGGVDLFPSAGQTRDLACRVYATPSGLAGLPTQAQIRDALAVAL